MGITKRTVTECTCDICSASCGESDGTISIKVNGGDCSKHGRYYGHCHSCANDAQEAQDRANDQAKRAREDALRDAEEKARDLIAKHKGGKHNA